MRLESITVFAQDTVKSQEPCCSLSSVCDRHCQAQVWLFGYVPFSAHPIFSKLPTKKKETFWIFHIILGHRCFDSTDF